MIEKQLDFDLRIKYIPGMSNAGSPLSPGAPESRLEAIKSSLCAKLATMLQAGKMNTTVSTNDGPVDKGSEAIAALRPGTLLITVNSILPKKLGGVPSIMLGVKTSALGASDGIRLATRSSLEGDELSNSITAADFATLCEDAVTQSIARYEALLRTTPAESLARAFNEMYTYRSLYEMQIGLERETLDWIRGQSPDALKEQVKFI